VLIVKLPPTPLALAAVIVPLFTSIELALISKLPAAPLPGSNTPVV
jgi:hypothetical protein